MNIRILFLIVIIPMSPLAGSAQEIDDKIIFSINGTGVGASEFIRMYKKNAEPGKPGDPDSYLQQYILFKQKVFDAVNEGMDTTRRFREELNGYRNQLAMNYLTDIRVKEKFLEKIYRRSLTDVNAWHVLARCPPDARPADTLKAWHKAEAIRQRIIAGEPFDKVAGESSDDPTAKINGGNLGYFNVLQMVMPFEDAAYSLGKGEVSNPVRTSFGYHIIRVADIRASRGRILTAHIMKAAPPGSGPDALIKAEESINAIYSMLEGGASFSSLAEQYSDHKESAVRGGRLNWFGTGEIIPEFAEAAFALSDTGKYTRPVRSPYGWHVIKLLDREAAGNYETTKSLAERRVNKEYLNSLGRKSFIDDLKKQYLFRVNTRALNWFIVNTDTLIVSGKGKYDRKRMPAGDIYTFSDQHLTTGEFATYLEAGVSAKNIPDNPRQFILNRMDTRAAEHIMKYENSILENKYPEFLYLVKEFHDGILLFEISGARVWNRSQVDTAGLYDYYQEHKHLYLSRRGIDAKLYMLRSAGADKRLLSAYKKYSRRDDTDSLLTREFNRNGDSLLVIKEGKWFAGDDSEIDKINWIKGPQAVRINSFPAILNIRNIMEPAPLPLQAVQGEMISGYQEYLENEWIKQLKEKYIVKVDYQLYDQVKKMLTDE